MITLTTTANTRLKDVIDLKGIGFKVETISSIEMLCRQLSSNGKFTC